MLPLPDFDLHTPRTVSEAARLLTELPGARLIAGGTDLLPSMKYGLFEPPALIRLSRVRDLDAIEITEDGAAIGAGATLRAVAAHPVLRARLPALAAACRTVATPTLQAMGTLGGNVMLDTRCLYYNQSTFWRGALGGCLKCETGGPPLCHVAPRGKGCYAAHSADTVPVLMLLDAEVELVSVRGRRRLPLAELYGDDGRTWLNKAPDELLTRLFVPWLPEGARVVHRKLRARGAIDYPLLLTAVRLDPDGGRVVLSALGPRPVEIEGVAAAMTARDVEAVADAAYAQAAPLSTHAWPSTWRKKMVRVEVRRALAQASSR
ncbi:MAG: FAD binding domain-containing protein [Alphaproteobacteria bacterium]|nr:FAD binding domain-containing protein [Alphaproteobacteria bacterium]